MSRPYKLIPSFPGSSNLTRTSPTISIIDWSKCALCQEENEENLLCPARSTRASYGSGYDSIASNLLAFQELGPLPLKINIHALDEGDGIPETLKSHEAVWHKSCLNKFSTLKLQRAQKRKSEELESPSPVKTRASFGISRDREIIGPLYFFCDKNEEYGVLHNVISTEVDEDVKTCAKQLRDTRLLAKLSAGDMHAQDAFYHKKCMTALHNRVRATEKTNSEDSAQTSPKSIALAELASFIEESKLDSEVAPMLVKLYVDRLQQLKACVPDRVNSTRLKDRLLAQIPALRAQNKGREVFLVYDKDIGAALQFAVGNSNDSNAVHLAKAAQIVRKDMLEKKQNFNGTFISSCQKDSVPTSLLALVTMMLEGPNIQDQTDLETIESDINNFATVAF